ncbi:Outer membrane protein (porin) [Mitsuaria sp. PDC51]|uniref:porin n=1 Tax=unclassified Roseateles TaxID=2626991 RepID=UPI0008EAF270|nr:MULTISPECIES: porin [unclassified Roseateles]MBB3283052.1 putative porin [Mitsuaria sp. BK037]SFR89841.1 Outer membrane protein (porin) [Mitsuaria sp. PDC51]
MKKSLVALAVLAGFAGAAAAQSSVTLFGVIDLAARYTKANGQDTKQLSNDGSSSSRIGVRGVEDLGGGLKAGFWLEGALSADSGTADSSRFWGRRASVSLMGDFGEVRLGRGKTSTRLVVDDFDVYTTTGLGDVTRLYSTFGLSTSLYDTNNRADNLVQYFLPSDLGGVYGSFDVAAGEGAQGKKMYGGRLGYKAGDLNVAGGYQTTDTLNTKFKQLSLGASYDFKVVKVSGLYSQLKLSSFKQNIYTIGAVVPVTAAGSVTAQFSKASTNSAADALITAPSATNATPINGAGDSKAFTIGYQHNLSKRTALYSTASYIKNDGNANFRVGNNAVAAARGGKSGGLDVGIKHSF